MGSGETTSQASECPETQRYVSRRIREIRTSWKRSGSSRFGMCADLSNQHSSANMAQEDSSGSVFLPWCSDEEPAKEMVRALTGYLGLEERSEA
jgi:hypothetical protein